MPRILKIIHDLFEVVFPFSCHVCRASVKFGKVLCSACRDRFERSLHPPARVSDVKCRIPILTLSAYEGTVAKLIKTVKFRPSKRLIPAVSELISPHLKRLNEFKPQLVIPVPLHAKRRERRGFNQAELIARIVASALNIPFCPALVRSRATDPQAEADAEARRKNLVGAFSLADGLETRLLEGKCLCLVDDVATTGATLDECARPLGKISSSQVFALVLAHAIKWI